jgi:copper chaperone CopZ
MGERTESKTVVLSVTGMTCPNCVRHVTGALTSLHGVLEVEVDLDGGRATVRLGPGAADADTLAAAVRDAGYEAGILEG